MTNHNLLHYNQTARINRFYTFYGRVDYDLNNGKKTVINDKELK